MSKAYTQAVAMQRKAANPQSSVFVSANAGSGKTRVLVDRVSRLLLAGAEPDKILALTYTKAAAAEMQSRLFDALGKWSIMDTDDLNAQLNALQGMSGQQSPAEIGRARQLFAKALETPGGLKVQTIHAFCEKLLRQFPLEAGLAAGSEAMDEGEAKTVQQQVIEAIEDEIARSPNAELAQDFTALITHTNAQTLDAVYSFAMGNADKVADWHVCGVAPLAAYFGIGQDADANTLKTQFWQSVPKPDLQQAIIEMQASTKTDQKTAEIILSALSAPDAETAFDLYRDVFFTQGGSLRKSIVGVNCGPTAQALFGSEKKGYGSQTKQMVQADEQIKSANALGLSRAALHLAIRASADYQAAKARRRVIDFDDQIDMACALLNDSAARDWVRYKLDGGVDHILVDEAQDTSKKQWQIINALSGEFFQPSPDDTRPNPRTMFAVGDEKQSIYSFQGASPEQFLLEMQALSTKQTETPQVSMNMSFRSTPPILQFIDQVFYEQKGIQHAFDPNVLPPGSDKGFHTAYRDSADDPGLIEMWPVSPKPDKPQAEIASEPLPVDAPDQSSSREKLAVAIAQQIKTWLADGEPVRVREGEGGSLITRPMRASDVMILVKGRQPFFDALIRNLKIQAVPVAGADRLKLTDSIAVQDLLSLAKFTLNPRDDLSLAEVLKSPIINWDDQRLEDVAYIGARSGTLWEAMPDGPERDLLRRLIALSHRHAPYEFFARTLALRPGGGAMSIKGRMLARLGGEILDALDAFLARALDYQRRGAPSLMAFVREIALSDEKIKRELDSGAGEVRVMTVYGAKGLEAPVVILPDTTSVPSMRYETLLPVTGGGYALSLTKGERSQKLTALYEDRQQQLLREDMRLLYVALSRAESRLLICGYENRGAVAEKSWYMRLQSALAAMQTKTLKTPFGEGMQFGGLPKITRAVSAPSEAQTPIPDWANSSLADIDKQPRLKSPSKLIKDGEDKSLTPPVRSPLVPFEDAGDRFARGNHIHKLLEVLPDIAPAHRAEKMQAYLHSQGVVGAQASDIETTVLATLDAPDFAHVFGPGSKPEVSLIGTIETPDGPLQLSGQIDRLCVLPDRVLIVDYKSNRPPPKRADDVDPLYVRQMAAYRKLVQAIYPGKAVHALLLWTDGPMLMQLPSEMLDGVDWAALSH